jgi:hypothetical protein
MTLTTRNHFVSVIALLFSMLVWNVSVVAASPATGVNHLVLKNELEWEGSSVLQIELWWAEHSIEQYNRRNSKFPLRSSIRAAHVHSEQWLNDSREHLENNHVIVADDDSSPQKNLRGKV